MTNATTPPGDSGKDRLGEREQQWWDRLAGRPTVASDEKSLARAALVREAILKEYRAELEASSNDAEADERARQQVLFEARRRGLIGSEPSARARRSWWDRTTDPVSGTGVRADDRRKWLGGMAAAVMLGVFGLYQVQREGEDAGPQFRGDTPTQRLTDPDPPKRADAIATDLRQAGAQVRIHPGKKATWLEIEVPPENFDSLSPALTQAGIKPEAGLLIVKIERP